jgi:hypothetical protein
LQTFSSKVVFNPTIAPNYMKQLEINANHARVNPVTQGSETTRYLCAAAQVDRFFRNDILDKLLHDSYRAISVPAGLDLFVVVKHCLGARNRKIIRDVVIVALLIVAALTSLSTVESSTLGASEDVFTVLLLGVLIRLFSIHFVLAWLTTGFELWFTRYFVIAGNLLKRNFNPNCIQLRAETDLQLQRKLSEFLKEEDCNAVVYSGFSPFVGSGIDIGGWSFAVNTARTREKLGEINETKPFAVQDLYSHIAISLKKLALERTTIQDKVFVNGQEIRGDQRFLPTPFQRPIMRVSPDEIANLIGSQSDIARHYQCIRIIGWQGEIVLSIFLRFVKLPQSLYMEASYFLLTPLKEEYRKIDEIEPHPTWRQILSLIMESFLKTIFLFSFWGSLMLLLGEAYRPYSRWRKQKTDRRLIRENPMFDYGATSSIREVASANSYRHYFLDDHNIDTSELQARQDAILNNGVIVTGGSIEAQNLSVGAKAKSVVHGFSKAVATATQTPKPK